MNIDDIYLKSGGSILLTADFLNSILWESRGCPLLHPAIACELIVSAFTCEVIISCPGIMLDPISSPWFETRVASQEEWSISGKGAFSGWEVWACLPAISMAPPADLFDTF